MKRLPGSCFVLFLFTGLFTTVFAGTIYYVDSQTGNDQNPGTAPEKAWKSLDKVNQHTFGPGDKILFKAGSRYTGQIAPKGSGKEGRPIIMDVYGKGDRPRIDGEGKEYNTFVLNNVEYWEVANLEITNTGKKIAPRCGVTISLHDFGTARHIHLKNLYIHDVNGTNVKADGGGAGISWGNGGEKVKSRFDGLLIENCRLVRTDRNGITGGGYFDRMNWYPSLNVVIRGNVLEDIGGDGIVPIGTDGCLVEKNIIRGARRRAKDAACGIWPWGCDNTVIQFNEVSGVLLNGGVDGQGYDSDYNCRNTIFQYNYSHDNEGGFFMACNWAKKGDPSDAGNVGVIVRYNISQNDGISDGKTDVYPVLFVGPVQKVQFYNNVIYLSNRIRRGIARIDTSESNLVCPANVKFYNNIFYAEPEAKIGWVIGRNTEVEFANNIFFGKNLKPPQGFTGIMADPMFMNPGSGKAGLDSLDGYKLKDGSPCIGAGRVVKDNGGRDFWGSKLIQGKKPSIGAQEK